MAKSKRNKIVHLTKVQKKGKDHKEDLMKQIEQHVAQFKKVYIFDFDQTPSNRIMELRLKLKGKGIIFAGKNSLVSSTLKTIGSRTNTDFEDLVKHVSGHRGLLFTDLEHGKLVDLLDTNISEFCKKLLGYAHIAPEVILPIESSEDGKLGPKLKRTKKKKTASKREVKFVKV